MTPVDLITSPGAANLPIVTGDHTADIAWHVGLRLLRRSRAGRAGG